MGEVTGELGVAERALAVASSIPLVTPARTRQLDRSRFHAAICAQTAEEWRGRDTVILDLTQVTPMADFFVITTGTNPRQMLALAEEVRLIMKARGNLPIGREGEVRSPWVLQDYGDIVLHALLPDARASYDLEGLWADAKRVDWKAVLAEHESQTIA